MSKGIRAIGFDLDGTLIDSEEAIVASFILAFEEVGGPVPDAKTIQGTISVPLYEQLAILVDGDVTAHADAYRRHYARIAPGKADLFPGVREALHRAHQSGLHLGVATSKRREAAEQHLNHLGIRDLFQCCIGPEDVQNPKPAPDAIHLLCEQLDVQPDELAYIGDSPLDLRAATSAGAYSVGVLTGSGNLNSLTGLGASAIEKDLGGAIESLWAGCCGNLLTDPLDPN